MSNVNAPKKPPQGIPGYVGWLILASIFVVPTVAGVFYWMLHEPEMPRVTRASLKAAQAKWDASGVKSYDLQVQTQGGLNTKIIQVEVRDGKVVKCLENGIEPGRQYWDFWTIPHQFEMISEDVAKDETDGFRKQSNVKITLHAKENPQFGFPDHYARKAHGPSPLYVQWLNMKFTPVTE